MRVFFALEFDDGIKQNIKGIQNIIKDNSIRGNFSHGENFHLTLRFIGEVEVDELEKLKNSLDSAVLKINQFYLSFEGVGFFNKENKKIVWIGIKSRDKSLNKLYLSLEEALFNNGFPREPRGYNPHITLSRETIFKTGFARELENIRIPTEDILINKVSLMESTRINGKLTYKAVYVKKI